MSTRTNLRPQVVLNAASMAADQTSTATVLQSITKVAYEVSWTGTSPVGTVSVQVSNSYSLDPAGAVASAGNWSTMTVNYNGALVTVVPITGNSGVGLIDITVTAGYATRLIYTHASGTGSITAIINGKVS